MASGTALVVGAGYLGDRVARMLTARGDRVWGLARSPRAGVPYETVVADITNPATLSELPEVQVVVFSVAPDDSDEAGYRDVYVRGIQHVVERLRRTPPHRVVLVSSTSVYGADGGEWVDETSPVAPGSFRGEVMLEAEAIAASGPWTTIAMRASGLYGPGRSRLIDHVQRGDARRAANDRFVNQIHIDDCAAAVRHLVGLGSPDSVYIASDRRPASYNEVITWLATQLQRPIPPLEPEPVTARPHKRCRSDRLGASGFIWKYPTYREGMASIVAGKRER